MDQDVRQVLFVQDEQVGESVRLHIGGAPVPSAPRQQTDRWESTICLDFLSNIRVYFSLPCTSTLSGSLFSVNVKGGGRHTFFLVLLPTPFQLVNRIEL